MAEIHPTSMIEPGAELADDVVVGPFCHVGPKVTLGPGCRLIGHVSILGRTSCGAHNTFWPQCVVGGDPQDLKFRGEDSRLILGDHNDIRECVTIHKGTDADAGLTQIGDYNLLMAYVHVGHDSIVGSHTVIANAVQLAGHVRVEDHANVGGAAAIHHFVTVGRFAFVAGMTRLVHDVPPFMVVDGNPARVRKVNTVLLKRHRFPDDQIERLKLAYRRLYAAPTDGRSGGGSGGQSGGSAVSNFEDRLADLEREFPDDADITTLTQSLRRAADGVFGRHREAARRDNRYVNPVR